MMLMEPFVPQGTLTEAQRRCVSERLVTEVMSAESAPADLRAELSARVTRALAGVAGDPQRLYFAFCCTTCRDLFAA